MSSKSHILITNFLVVAFYFQQWSVQQHMKTGCFSSQRSTHKRQFLLVRVIPNWLTESKGKQRPHVVSGWIKSKTSSRKILFFVWSVIDLHLPAMGKIVTRQSAMARWRKSVVVLFFLILFLNSLDMASVLPMMESATRPENFWIYWNISGVWQ